VSIQEESKTDAAALGGGVVAIAMAMFADPTPYDMLSMVVALTLAILILAYLGGHRRSWPERIAYAAVLGIIFVPIWGFIADTWKLPIWTRTPPEDGAEALAFARDHGVQPTIDALTNLSTVSDGATVAVWVLVTLAVAIIDWLWHRDHQAAG
jgi:hypothetical protein